MTRARASLLTFALLTMYSAHSFAQGSTSAPEARFRLVRCAAKSNEYCLTVTLRLPAGTSLNGAQSWSAQLLQTVLVGSDQPFATGSSATTLAPVFLLPVLPSTSLARTRLRGKIVLHNDSGTSAFSTITTWRPPRIALPGFTGVADHSAMPPAVTEAISLAAEPPSVRPLVALLLSLSAAMLLFFVPRLLWNSDRESEEDVARELAATRALLTASEMDELRSSGTPAAVPRHPEEPTQIAKLSMLEPPA